MISILLLRFKAELAATENRSSTYFCIVFESVCWLRTKRVHKKQKGLNKSNQSNTKEESNADEMRMKTSGLNRTKGQRSIHVYTSAINSWNKNSEWAREHVHKISQMLSSFFLMMLSFPIPLFAIRNLRFPFAVCKLYTPVHENTLSMAMHARTPNTD